MENGRNARPLDVLDAGGDLEAVQRVRRQRVDRRKLIVSPPPLVAPMPATAAPSETFVSLTVRCQGGRVDAAAAGAGR